jgi:hypothetical protein
METGKVITLYEAIEAIYHLSKLLGETELEQVSIEETLLLQLVKRPRIALAIKHEAFLRLTEINRLQLGILGHKE